MRHRGLDVGNFHRRLSTRHMADFSGQQLRPAARHTDAALRAADDPGYGCICRSSVARSSVTALRAPAALLLHFS